MLEKSGYLFAMTVLPVVAPAHQQAVKTRFQPGADFRQSGGSINQLHGEIGFQFVEVDEFGHGVIAMPNLLAQRAFWPPRPVGVAVIPDIKEMPALLLDHAGEDLPRLRLVGTDGGNLAQLSSGEWAGDHHALPAPFRWNAWCLRPLVQRRSRPDERVPGRA